MFKSQCLSMCTVGWSDLVLFSKLNTMLLISYIFFNRQLWLLCKYLPFFEKNNRLKENFKLNLFNIFLYMPPKWAKLSLICTIEQCFFLFLFFFA